MTKKTPDILYAFVGDLEKSYDDAGVLHVRGVATDPSLDLDGQRCDPQWLKSAMPAWMEWGNVREMHGASAVGTATEMTQEGTKWVIGADIVDPSAAKKVESGVYKGFSIGIKGHTLDKSAAALELAPNGIINGGEIVEVSLVDRPANPAARLEVAKMVDGVLVKADENSTSAEITAEGTPCVTCGGVGMVHNEGGVTEDLHTCPDCGGSGESTETGGVNIRPSQAGGDQDNGEVADNLDDTRGKAGDPDCKTCGGKGTIRDGHVDCPDCSKKDATADLEKKDYSDKDRKEMAENGQAMPGGGFPIKNKTDLHNAIQSIGRAKNPAQAKAHIKRRAKALGLSDMIPDTWKSPLVGIVEKYATLTKAADGDSFVHDPADLEAVRSGIVDLLKAELDEYASGEDESWDIAVLTDVLNGFSAWWNHESFNGETSSPFPKDDDMNLLSLGVSADLVKAASADTATDEDRAALRQDLVKALGLDDIATVKAANEELVKKVADLTTQLDAVKQMAAPRDYALRATQEQKAKASVREGLLAKAADLRASANLYTDPTARSEFLVKAVELENQAASIINESEN